MSNSVLKGIEDVFERTKLKNVARLKKRKLPYDELLDLAATFMSVYDEEAKAHQRTILSMKGGAAQLNEYAENLPEEIAKILLNERSERARLAVLARLETDPKQKEKQFVYELWLQWEANPDSYKGKASFARDMLSKCEHLTSQKKIEDWCRKWEKANPAG